jgi:hypothetical protein
MPRRHRLECRRSGRTFARPLYVFRAGHVMWERRRQWPPTMETTIDLLARVKQGDAAAVSELMERSVPPLRRWARGRIPPSARALAETQDIVRDAITRTLPRLNTFEATHPDSLAADRTPSFASFIRLSLSSSLEIAPFARGAGGPRAHALRLVAGTTTFLKGFKASDFCNRNQARCVNPRWRTGVELIAHVAVVIDLSLLAGEGR